MTRRIVAAALFAAKQYAQSAALYQQAWQREPNAALQYKAACSCALVKR